MQKISTVNSYNSNLTLLNNSNTVITVTGKNKFFGKNELLLNFMDLIPDDGYGGFYVNKVKELGWERFAELANKARANSNSPQRLFCWMLKNSRIVK